MHADGPDGIGALGGLGIRSVTLSNGSTSVAEALFEPGRSHFEELLATHPPVSPRWLTSMTAITDGALVDVYRHAHVVHRVSRPR